MLIINAGSSIAKVSVDTKWTNTHEKAAEYCKDWFLKPMLEQGFKHIEFIDTGKHEDGRWTFEFKHKVTGVTVEAQVHGIYPLAEYEREFIFTPRTYWKGSSSANPTIEDFASEGYVPVVTYMKETQ